MFAVKPGTLSGEGIAKDLAEPATTAGTLEPDELTAKAASRLTGAADPPADGLARAATVPTPPRGEIGAYDGFPRCPTLPAGRWLVVAAVRSPVVDPARKNARTSKIRA